MQMQVKTSCIFVFLFESLKTFRGPLYRFTLLCWLLNVLCGNDCSVVTVFLGVKACEGQSIY